MCVCVCVCEVEVIVVHVDVQQSNNEVGVEWEKVRVIVHFPVY